MPYIDVKLSKNIDSQEKLALKSKLGELISVFPGKSENWLMCNIESDKDIYFQGNNSQHSAFVEVKLFGSINKSGADSFTAELCSYLENSIGIPSSRIYIRYSCGTDWGWNGNNF